MRPLQLAFWGLLIVFVDLRIQGFDLAVDLVGWGLTVNALRRLRGRDTSFLVATVAASVAGIGSVMLWAPDLVAGGTSLRLLSLTETVMTAVVVFATCTGIARVLAHEHPVVRQARALRVADLVVTLVAVGVTAAFPTTTATITAPFVGGMVLALVVLAATFAVMILFLVLLWSVRNRPQLQEAEPIIR